MLTDIAFPHELVQRHIDALTKALENEKQRLKNISLRDSAYWDIYTDISTFIPAIQELQGAKDTNIPNITLYYYDLLPSMNITINVQNKLKPEEFDSLFDKIESVFNDYGFYLNTSNTYTYTPNSYVFKNENSDNIYLKITKTTCKMVPTGKMIPEVKRDCSII